MRNSERIENVEDGRVVMSEKEIDEVLEASFPASDPPSWTLGTDRSRIDPEPVETGSR